MEKTQTTSGISTQSLVYETVTNSSTNGSLKVNLEQGIVLPADLYVIIISVVGLFGITGNCLTLVVLLKRKRWTSVNFLLCTMSISDILCLLVSICIIILLRFRSINDKIFNVQDTFSFSSAMCAVVIGCERVFAVRNPLQFRKIWNTRLTIKLYIGGFIVGLGCVIFRVVVCETVGVKYFLEHVYIPYFIVVRGIPFLLIIIVNVLMLRGLIRSQKTIKFATQNKAEESRKHEVSVTRTVVVMTTVYFICMIPSRLSVGLRYAGIFRDLNKITFYLSGTFEIANYSVNIIIYTLTSKMFRNDYKRFICNHFTDDQALKASKYSPTVKKEAADNDHNTMDDIGRVNSTGRNGSNTLNSTGSNGSNTLNSPGCNILESQWIEMDATH